MRQQLAAHDKTWAPPFLPLAFWSASNSQLRTRGRTHPHVLKLGSCAKNGGRGRELALLYLDTRRLNDRPPFLHLGLEQCGERGRLRLVGRRDLLPEIGEALGDRGIRERFHRGPHEFCQP